MNILILVNGVEFNQEIPYIPRIGEGLFIEQLTDEDDIDIPIKGSSCWLKVTGVGYSNEPGNNPEKNGWRVIVDAEIVENYNYFIDEEESK